MDRRFVNARAVMAENAASRTTVSKVFEVLATSFASGDGELAITMFVCAAVASTFAPVYRAIGSQPLSSFHINGPWDFHGRSVRTRCPREASSFLTRATCGCLITQFLNSACQ